MDSSNSMNEGRSMRLDVIELYEDEKKKKKGQTISY
jgi:hypothetical protein